jgi:hypothetical protein
MCKSAHKSGMHGNHPDHANLHVASSIVFLKSHWSKSFVKSSVELPSTYQIAAEAVAGPMVMGQAAVVLAGKLQDALQPGKESSHHHSINDHRGLVSTACSSKSRR